MTNILLKEIIPRYGLPSSIQSDKTPSFMAEVSQQIYIVKTTMRERISFCQDLNQIYVQTQKLGFLVFLAFELRAYTLSRSARPFS
jgi:hypothetical protein